MKPTPEQREDIANKLADEGWCPESSTTEQEDGYLIEKWMFIRHEEIDAEIAEMTQCAAEEKADADREERMLGHDQD